MRQVKPMSLTNSSVGTVLLLAATGWGVFLRILPLWMADLPTYHSGGLFYVFSTAIREANFALPEFIPHYTLGGIPYAYPPLGFYLVAVLDALLETGPIGILYVNVVLSVLAVIVFHKVIVEVEILSVTAKGIALLTFASLPSLLREVLPGEGLAESVGLFVFVLYLWQLKRFGQATSVRGSIILGVLLGLNVLASPGTAYAAPVLLVLKAVVAGKQQKRNKLVFAFGLTVAVGIVVASPYLITIIGNHGVGVFFASFANEQSSYAATLLQSIELIFLTQEAFFFPSMALLLAPWGLLRAILTRRFELVAMMLFLLTIPREGRWLYTIPVALISGLGWDGFVRPAIQASLGHTSLARQQFTQNALLIVLVPFTAGLTPLMMEIVTNNTGAGIYFPYVTPDEEKTLAVIKDLSKPSDTFLVFSNEIEWFPFLTGRTVLNIDYGTEWVPEKRNAIVQFNLMDVPQCDDADDLLAVLRQANEQHPEILPYPTFLYLSTVPDRPRNNPNANAKLIASLKAHPAFISVYETDTTILMRFAPALAGLPAEA